MRAAGRLEPQAGTKALSRRCAIATDSKAANACRQWSTGQLDGVALDNCFLPEGARLAGLVSQVIQALTNRRFAVSSISSRADYLAESAQPLVQA